MKKLLATGRITKNKLRILEILKVVRPDKAREDIDPDDPDSGSWRQAPFTALDVSRRLMGIDRHNVARALRNMEKQGLVVKEARKTQVMHNMLSGQKWAGGRDIWETGMKELPHYFDTRTYELDKGYLNTIEEANDQKLDGKWSISILPLILAFDRQMPQHIRQNYERELRLHTEKLANLWYEFEQNRDAALRGRLTPILTTYDVAPFLLTTNKTQSEQALLLTTDNITSAFSESSCESPECSY